MTTLSMKKFFMTIGILGFIAVQFSGCVIDPNRHFKDSPRSYDSREHDDRKHDNRKYDDRQHDNRR